MRKNRVDLFSLSALGLAAAGVMTLAGCASGGGASATSAATTAPAAAPAPAPAPAPEPAAPAGLGYAEIATTLKGPIARARQELVGQTVSVDLQKATGKGAVAGTYMVQAGDNVFFRCLSTERGFQGGPVSAEVRAVRMPANGATRTVELARCEAGGAAAPAPAPAAAPAPRAAAPAPAPAPAAAAPAPAASGGAGTVGAGKPGMDARGNVVDSSKVEAGSGRTVKGINDYEGEITGNPGPGSKFTRLQIGMPVRQVTDLIGPPTDQGAYVTGKAFIPFYFGGDRHRYEMTYKGQGRLIFAGGGMGDFTSGNLIWIIHNPNESGYR